MPFGSVNRHAACHTNFLYAASSFQTISRYNQHMKVNLFANFRKLVGGKTVEIELPEGSTLTQLFDSLILLHPRLEPALFDESRKILPFVHVFINGRDTQYLPAGTATLLAPADKIDIFPPVAGG